VAASSLELSWIVVRNEPPSVWRSRRGLVPDRSIACIEPARASVGRIIRRRRARAEAGGGAREPRAAEPAQPRSSRH
jgi:hypothetical protein